MKTSSTSLSVDFFNNAHNYSLTWVRDQEFVKDGKYGIEGCILYTASIINLEIVAEVLDMNINRSDTAFELNIKLVGLTLLGRTCNIWARAKHYWIMSTYDTHIKNGYSRIDSFHPSLVSHGGWTPIVVRVRLGDSQTGWYKQSKRE